MASPEAAKSTIDLYTFVQGIVIGVSSGLTLSALSRLGVWRRRRNQIDYLYRLIQDRRETLLSEIVRDQRSSDGQLIIKGEDLRHRIFANKARRVKDALKYRADAMKSEQISDIYEAFKIYDDLGRFGRPVTQMVYEAIDKLRFLKPLRRLLKRRQSAPRKPL